MRCGNRKAPQSGKYDSYGQRTAQHARECTFRECGVACLEQELANVLKHLAFSERIAARELIGDTSVSKRVLEPMLCAGCNHQASVSE